MQIAIWQAPAQLRSREMALAELALAAERAAAAHARWLLVPEFFYPGCNAPDALRLAAEPSDGPFACGVAAIARRHRLAIATAYVESAFGHLFSAALCVDAAGIALAHYRRVHLQPGEEVLLSPGQWTTLAPADGLRIGLLLGADLLMPEAARVLGLCGAGLIFCLGAPAGLAGPAIFSLAAARAIETGVPLALASLVGTPAGVFASDGCELSRADPATGLRFAKVPDACARSLPQRRPELYRILCADAPLVARTT